MNRRMLRRISTIGLMSVLSALGASAISAQPAAAALTGCLAGDIVDVASSVTGNGYLLLGSDGGVFSYGDSPFKGSMGGKPLNAPIISLVRTASGKGYWEIGGDGGVFAFGDALAPATNPLPGTRLNSPIVEATRIGDSGLLLVAGDGGIFALNGAPFYGSMGGRPLNAPMVDIVPSPTAQGYATIAADGGVFAFGDYQGPAGNQLPSIKLNQPITGAARYGTGFGLELVAGDGGTFALGGAPFIGSASSLSLARPITAIALNTVGSGEWLASADGGVFAYGNSGFFGNAVSSANCPATLSPTNGSAIVQIATSILDGQKVNPWNGGGVPYVWGGGHGAVAGPSTGTCAGYTGSVTHALLPPPSVLIALDSLAGSTRLRTGQTSLAG